MSKITRRDFLNGVAVAVTGAAVAGPAGMVVVSPKNSTSMPLPTMSRSLSSPPSPPLRRVPMIELPDAASSGTMVRPMAARCSTK